MFVSAREFWVLCAFSAVTGAMLGMVYDVLNILLLTVFKDGVCVKASEKRVLCGGKNAERALFPIDMNVTVYDAVRFAADILFCVFSAFAVIVLIYHLNYGEIRVFSLVSAVTGFAVYKKTVGRPLSFLLLKALQLIKKALIKIIYSVMRPIVYPIKLLTVRIYGKVKARAVRKRALKAISLMENSEMTRRNKRKI